ncbi:MAG: bepA 2 [Planctomycetaceae bacterium]|nr:bepA 2 [Planctomycetaceae bacterium]
MAIVLVVIAVVCGPIRWLPRTWAVQALDAYDNQNALRWLGWSAWVGNDAGEIALGRVRAYRRLRQFDQVRAQLLRASAAGVSRQKLEREQWLTLAQAGQMESIESKLPALLDDSQVDPRDVCEAYATGFLLTARPGPALNLIVPWIADYPHDNQAYYLRGKAYALGRHYTEAEQALREARRLAPRRTEIALALAEALLQLQQPEVALPLFEFATTDAALSDQAWLGVAQSARRMGQADKALTVLKELLVHAPKISVAWEELGRAQSDRQEVTDAISSLEKAVALSPNSLSAQQALGRALMANGEQTRAQRHIEYGVQATTEMERIRLLEDHCELHPNDAASRFQIAEFYRKYDTPDLAIAWARSVLILLPEHQQARKLLDDLISATKDDSRN